MATPSISKSRIDQLLADIRAKKLAPTVIAESLAETNAGEVVIHGIGKHGEAITYNREQQLFIKTTLAGSDCILIGAAGTGKTTCVMGSINSLVNSGTIPMLDSGEHKHLPYGKVPGIIATSFTRRAVRNLKKAMPPGLEGNCITIHKLLEFAPVKYEVIDPETGDSKWTQRFEPRRHQDNPLPDTIRVIYIDEASMVSTDLYSLLIAACPHKPQIIFVGDIQQLPPVFGAAILGYKMLELTTVELTEVYRQALESPIIKYATLIKGGHTIDLSGGKLIEETPKGKITFHPWVKKLSSDLACMTFCKFITVALEAGAYDQDNDCILIPFNKAFGTEEVNRSIANFIAKRDRRLVWEIQAGFNKVYFSIGDKVLFDKEDATIIEIKRNPEYLGKKPLHESVTLDYWGHDPVPRDTTAEELEDSLQDIDAMLDKVAAFVDSDEDRVTTASHIVTLSMNDSEVELEISSAATINQMLLSYAITVHKAQGSEWDKVFFILHQSHNTMIQRELLYTGVTRAAKELYIICESDSFVRGVKSQRIQGNTLAEKAIYFQGKVDANSSSYKIQ